MTSDHSPIYSTFTLNIVLPFVPPLLGPKVEKFCLILISDVRGLDLITGSGSKPAKPRLVFLADFMESYVLSTIKVISKNTVIPVWGEGDIPPLVPVVKDRLFLEKQHVFVNVVDWENENIAQGAISLKGACELNPLQFHCILSQNGKNAGTLKGTVNIIFPAKDTAWFALAQADNKKRRSKLH